ncbi:hypothetical protein BDW59DRAFT_168571 [Aspergillus cavernicola]|uniref:Uncharacterized protein n=1 Tax=Aspergillus cavernicola TaxID=176166 RepID=A0ABR4J2G3_9EURO
MTSLFTPRSLLCALGLLGFWGTHGRTSADGSTALITQLLDSPTPYLPGTQSVLRGTYTGIKPVDHILNILILFWFEAVDGSHPTASAISLYFLGQLLPCIIFAYLNGLRGNKPSLLKPTLWLLLFQVGAIGPTGFIWALAYTMSPTVQLNLPFDLLQQSSLVSSPATIWLLLPASIVGYLLPAVFMCLPSSSSTAQPPLVSNTFQQFAIIIWNIYPVLILASLYLIRPALSSSTTTASINAKKTTHIKAIRITTLLTLLLSSAFHISIIGLSLSTVLFPSLFQPHSINQLSPSAIFLPPLSPGPQALTPGDGVRGFLLWDQVVGYATVMVVVLLELRSALVSVQAWGWGQGWKVGGVAVGVSLVLGPGSACLVGSWLRDEILFGGWEVQTKGEKKEKL